MTRVEHGHGPWLERDQVLEGDYMTSTYLQVTSTKTLRFDLWKWQKEKRKPNNAKCVLLCMGSGRQPHFTPTRTGVTVEAHSQVIFQFLNNTHVSQSKPLNPSCFFCLHQWFAKFSLLFIIYSYVRMCAVKISPNFRKLMKTFSKP